MEEDTTFPVVPYPEDGVFNSLYETQYDYSGVYPVERKLFPANNLVQLRVVELQGNLLENSDMAIVEKWSSILAASALNINGEVPNQNILIRDMKVHISVQRRFAQLWLKNNIPDSVNETITPDIKIANGLSVYVMVGPTTVAAGNATGIANMITKKKCRIIDMIAPSDDMIVYLEPFVIAPDESVFIYFNYYTDNAFLREVFATTNITEISDRAFIYAYCDARVLASSPVVTN